MYDLIKLIHVVAVFGFLLAHGISAGVAFKLRSERNLERIRALLDLSSTSYSLMYPSLGILFLAGIVAGFMGSFWSRAWIWVSLILLIAILMAMYVMGSRYYSQVRKAVGLPYFAGNKEHPADPPLSAAEIDALLNQGRSLPPTLLLIGYGGTAVLAWLMMAKPF